MIYLGWYTDRAPLLRGIGAGHTGMASDTEIKFYGLWHLAGETVQVTINGLDCSDYTVATDGTITVPFLADQQDLLTPQYLVDTSGGDTEITYYLDGVLTTVSAHVVIGKAFISKGQVLRPSLGNDMGLRVPNGLGKVRRAHEFAALLHYVVDITFGTDFDGTMDTAILTTADGETPWPLDETYTGVYRGTLTDEYSYDSMLCWEVSRPVPAMVCAVSSYLVSEE